MVYFFRKTRNIAFTTLALVIIAACMFVMLFTFSNCACSSGRLADIFRECAAPRIQ